MASGGGGKFARADGQCTHLQYVQLELVLKVELISKKHMRLLPLPLAGWSVRSERVLIGNTDAPGRERTRRLRDPEDSDTRWQHGSPHSQVFLWCVFYPSLACDSARVST